MGEPRLFPLLSLSLHSEYSKQEGRSWFPTPHLLPSSPPLKSLLGERERSLLGERYIL